MKMRLTVDIDEMNYAEIIRFVLPYVKKEDIPIPAKILETAGNPGVLEGFLKLIPKKAQDEMVLKLVEKNKQRFINKAQTIAANRGMHVVVSDISLKENEDEVVVI